MINIPRGYERFSTLSGQQQDLYNTLLGKLKDQLGGEGMDRFQAPYLREFQEKIVPGLAERFAGMGAGAQSSSAFQQALGSSGTDLAERLGVLGSQREQGALSGLSNLLGMQTEGFVRKSKPWWQELLTGGSEQGGNLVSALVKLLPMLM